MANPSVVQTVAKTETTQATTLAFSGVTTTAGNRLVLHIGTRNTALTTVSSVADSAGNTWSKLLSTGSAATPFAEAEVWTTTQDVGPLSAGTITITYGASCTSEARLFELANVAAVSPVDVSASAHGSNTAPNSGATAAGAASGELILGLIAFSFSTTASAQAFTQGAPTNNYEDKSNVTSLAALIDSGYLTATGTTGQAYSATLAHTAQWAAICYLLKGGSNTTVQTLSVATATAPTLVKSVGKSLSIATATTPSLTKSVTKTLALATATAATLATAKVKIVTLAVVTATAPTIKKAVGKGLNVATATAPSLIKSVGKNLSLATATASSVATSKVKIVALAVVTATAPTITKAIGKTLNVATATAPSLTKKIAKGLVVVTATAPSVAKSIGKGLSVATATAVSLIAALLGHSAGPVSSPTLVSGSSPNSVGDGSPNSLGASAGPNSVGDGSPNQVR